MQGYVATIGMFDGVHLGHQFVLHRVVDEARKRGLQSLAITFDRQQSTMLTTLEGKRRLIFQTGIDRTEVLPFTDELKQLTAQAFMEQVLKARLGVKVLLIGYDNRFGHNRAEGFDDYVRYGQALGIEVIGLPPAPSEDRGDNVSSTLIRQLLGEGRVAEAATRLGYPYTIAGRVAHGEHVGTGLGFPTANLTPDSSRQLIPAAGVYAVTVGLEGSSGQKLGMMNIGHRPTFDGRQQTLEVHIFGFSADLYGQPMSVSFIERLREERRFDSPESLCEQLQQDQLRAEQLLKISQQINSKDEE